MIRGPIPSNFRVWITCTNCGKRNRVWSPTPVGLIICPSCKSKYVERVA